MNPDTWQWLAGKKWYRKWRSDRWIELPDGRWLRTMRKDLNYGAVEWYTDIYLREPELTMKEPPLPSYRETRCRRGHINRHPEYIRRSNYSGWIGFAMSYGRCFTCERAPPSGFFRCGFCHAVAQEGKHVCGDEYTRASQRR